MAGSGTFGCFKGEDGAGAKGDVGEGKGGEEECITALFVSVKVRREAI